MSIQVTLHKSHRHHTNGQETVEVDGQTVGACLDDLVRKYPGLKGELYDKKGNLKNIFTP